MYSLTETDECASDPCQNGATCVDGVAGFTCDCTEGFEGDLCGLGNGLSCQSFKFTMSLSNELFHRN